MFDPVSTYRIQFHKDFTFKHLEPIIPYLHQLGIKTLYASPVFAATPGSTHGYDVTNPLTINPEIGTLDELRAVSKKLKEHDINWLQDIVPNHMAFHPDNSWLMDVLANGKDSHYASFFDIQWDSPVYDGRVMVPFLGVTFDEAVEQQQIQLEKKNDKFYFTYFDQQYPVKADELEVFSASHIKKVNTTPELLKELSAKQAYQLCHWQETDSQINYRRFFTVNGLICLNMQYDEVFDEYHQLIKQLLEDGIFQGLRVDHVDGLYDPTGYLLKLRQLAGPDTYIIVEKILEKGEAFPADWPVQGNTGYDFLAIVNNLFTQKSNEELFTKNYQKVTNKKAPVDESIREKKAHILKQHMAGELTNLYQLFKNLELVSPAELSAIDDRLKDAIAQLLIYWPVYRFYGNRLPFESAEATELEMLITTVGAVHPQLANTLTLIRDVLLQRSAKGDEDYNKRALKFYQRCMQFTGPLMAKGVEDTLMYTYNRFVGHNEVGDAPDAFGLTPEEFHGLIEERQRLWPMSLNGTSTHDTKRGEDVRARLNVLSSDPQSFFDFVNQQQIPEAIDKNDAYFILQTIIGAHPMPQAGEDDFTQRMQEYLLKALREGKQNSDWANPDENYEEAIKNYIADLLDNTSKFKKSFVALQQHVADHGIINSLSQVLLKFTCPGVPDVYQGCELWDLSLVDPDNRRPVDYQLRAASLPSEVKYDEALWKELWNTRYSGSIKLQLTQRLLALRNDDPGAFINGDYLRLTISGKYKQHLFAFARHNKGVWYVTANALHTAALVKNASDIQTFDWADTHIELPEAAPTGWCNLLSGSKGQAARTLPVTKIFNSLPLALLKLERPADRGAGLLLHVTSLPSPFAVGDIGPEAYKFVDMLFNSGQRFWQMLPVNPVDKGAGYSPYSATSSLAGNVLLISPELLAQKGWLSNDELLKYQQPSTNRADLERAVSIKTQMFDKAYQQFIRLGDHQQFEQFKTNQQHWLNDFALYQVLKQLNHNKPWYQWPKPVKERLDTALQKVTEKNAIAVDKEKWLQFVFSLQWSALKKYASKKGITLFGDMPFYISYDSVDVWAHRELFKLDKQGKITGMAGVPPDYFSADGQLWGMPVFDWDRLKQNNYDWWLQRIQKNLEYFDLIRLDHFRAFAAYWEVPGGEQTAVNGKWMQGPGSDFFTTIKQALGYLPFVAEDLGDIDEAVHSLRDGFDLPGMRVLQFAFGDDMPVSDHIIHQHTVNSFAYTGTHDNNTTRGWYNQDVSSDGKTAINCYAGQKISGKNICEVFIRLCYASVARAAILPVQDVLALDGSHRMNMPGSAEGNWSWRVESSQLNDKVIRQLKDLTVVYNR